MAVTTTYSFELPTVGGEINSWGADLNANWAAIDALLAGRATITDALLATPTLTSPVITGGTIDGTPTGATTPSTGAFTALTVSSTLPQVTITETDQAVGDDVARFTVSDGVAHLQGTANGKLLFSGLASANLTYFAARVLGAWKNILHDGYASAVSFGAGLSVTGAFTAASAAVTGAVTGATGVFSGDVSAATGTFSGAVAATTDVSGATGTFSGAHSALSYAGDGSALTGIAAPDVAAGVAAITPTGVGSTIVAWNSTTGGYAAGASVAGANLYYANSATPALEARSSASTTFSTSGVAALPGTWEALVYSSGRTMTTVDMSPVYHWHPCLFKRTA
jgi:hypothetical protein